MENVREYLGGRFTVVVGDICSFDGDAIVNAANTSLAGGGGVDGAIHRAAGPDLLEECKRLRQSTLPDGLPAGKAVVTGAGKLPFKGIIHAVGPVWRGGHADEERLLSSAYRTSLELAAKNGWKSVAFPAISTGAYGYPKDGAARITYRTVVDFLARKDTPERVSLVFFSRKDADIFLDSVESGDSR
ncbi:MAG: O-acetyl-ADP-ribose deacetylase [Spirochaetales bacterium]|nr:MAG: O-acetyl-ADP-ribose deacetylase [Spirochaetales bacterium]